LTRKIKCRASHVTANHGAKANIRAGSVRSSKARNAPAAIISQFRMPYLLVSRQASENTPTARKTKSTTFHMETGSYARTIPLHKRSEGESMTVPEVS